MGWIAWIILGLVAGALARWLMPGEDKMGWILTILLGIGGAFVGGYLGSLLGIGSVSGFNIVTVITATVGAFILLFAYNKLILKK
ncbi:GlsB/YeaQ/YmgE family stress response membrane protein [Pseudoteredinibacter isoporae]|uniref:Putative membrane protein YeaQ/YmgE (Transglycosylase-associated protein family) n=1 Tax=Pseudoteredinibacter isoporae TaxID=570281 RepID=A0A7X0MUE4_9GAMM|nr:GlsB/YeaQ/YmgE family stress response membrane protein [Pseudoteredinibacter isoporae]MBB6520531.1 putative membrane protein YeaQ/YmgE (transglycosylase-associated protein family) [Pseudoteredinibacter isoporae]NHO86098.1 GlsB/YeaQ/YmgE family stress response membrane protein [Pseudoteredinibacter isoporae]NIB25451.1 GlsB/YeaQ/YmgE family stress response membrane protein [Pseudoteredinibacter isoporae]